jgi:immunity protein, SdpI family
MPAGTRLVCRLAIRRCEVALRSRSTHLAIIVMGYAASAAAYERLLPMYRGWVALLLPTAAAVIYTLFAVIWKRDFIRARDAAAEATYAAILFWILLFIVALHVTVLASAILMQEPARNPGPVVARAVPILLGLALAAIGNLLPKLQPNLVIGIRTSRTLADRGIWRRTNRVAGYAAVALGAIFVLAGGLMPHGTLKELVLGFSGLIALTIVIVTAWMAEPCPS